MNEEKLATARREYAKKVMAAFLLSDARLEGAFAELRREDFLGAGPWLLPTLDKGNGYHPTPDADPIHLYEDTVVRLISDRGLNNGMPSFNAFLIYLGHLRDGEHAVHIGAGVGYYTAIMARLVGSEGAVTAIEYEPELAARAARNLSAFTHVRVIEGDGFTMPLEPANAIYVNAGAARPADVWLDAMKDGGRMILPLAMNYIDEDDGRVMTRGAIFRIERHGNDYSARWMSPTFIYPCAGAHDAESETALAAAFNKGGWDTVTRLYRTADIPDDRCWSAAPAGRWRITELSIVLVRRVVHFAPSSFRAAVSFIAEAPFQPLDIFQILHLLSRTMWINLKSWERTARGLADARHSAFDLR